MKRHSRIRSCTAVVALALLLSACINLDEQTAGQAAQLCEAPPFDFAELDRVGGEGRRAHTHLIVHRGQRNDMQSEIHETLSASMVEGNELTVYSLDSSNAASMRIVGTADFVGTALNREALERELQPLSAATYCDVIASINLPAQDNGADLIGSLDVVLTSQSVQTSAAPVEVIVLTDGGIHRTHELDLGDEMVERAAWKGQVDSLSDAVAAVEDPRRITVTAYGIARVGSASDSVASKAVLDQTKTLWADICRVLEKDGITCLATW